MAPSTKAKAAGVSASSFLDLKAELAKHEEEFSKHKAAGKSNAIVGGVKRPGKKPTVWARHNKGVNARASRDIELEAVSKPTLEAARAILERKAQVYEKLSKGKSGGLNEKQYNALLVDFDQKPIDAYESDSDDVDESLTVPKRPDDDNDPIVEYEDEFGRARSARKSEVPRHLLPPDPNDVPPEEDIDPFVIYNPVNHFPIYEPSAERVAAIQAEFAEENNPLNIHYDASQEVRAKGAGFYQFSADEETRKQQMEELKRAREETEKTREELGAVDVRPGQMEGMVVPGEEAGERAGPKQSRAMEKRKRELEERRKLVEAKRRKKEAAPSAEGSKAGTPLEPESSPKTAPAVDPLAALEVQSTVAAGKGKMKATAGAAPTTAADDFLAKLEQEIMGGLKR